MVLRPPMWCHTGMSCHTHRTWHPTWSQYTDTGPTCRCAIHWIRCGTSHWNTQLPILMSWVRPNREIHPWVLPWPSTNTSERSTLWCCYGGKPVRGSVWSVPYPPDTDPGTCGVWIHYAIHLPIAASNVGRIH